MRLILLLILLSQVCVAEKIVLTTGEWPPYVSQYLKHKGVLSQIVVEAFKEEGIEVELSFMPWKRAFVTAQKGLSDGTFVWSAKKERYKDFYYTESVSSSAYYLFYMKGLKHKGKDYDWQNVDDLAGLRIGGTVGYAYTDEFLQAIKDKKLDASLITSDEQNICKLLTGRIDLFPSDLEVGYYLARNAHGDDAVKGLTHHPKPLKKESPLHVLISKAKPNGERLQALFNKGLQKLKADGRIKKYLQDSRAGKYLIKKEDDEFLKLIKPRCWCSASDHEGH